MDVGKKKKSTANAQCCLPDQNLSDQLQQMFEMQMGSTHSLCDVLQQMIIMYPEFVPTSFNAEPSPQTCNLEELEMAIEHFPNM